MTKNTSKRKVKILSFASLPFVLSAFVLFSQKSFAQEVEKKAKKVEEALEKPVQSQADLVFDQVNNLGDTLLNSEKIEQTKTVSKKEKVLTKDQLKDILKSNPQNKIILNDAGDIILNDSIKIKDIVLKKELVPTILYGTDGKVLQKIDPKDIDKVFVRKNEGLIEIVKKDSSVIKIFNSEKDIPNIDKKVTTAKIPIVKNNITLKNGYSIYTDKKGVEHKIQSNDIDNIYLSKNKKGVIENKKIDLPKFPKNITNLKVVTKYENNDMNTTALPKNGHSVSYTFTETNQSMAEYLDEKLKELKLDEQNTKKKIEEVEKLLKEERRKEKSN